MKLHDLPEGDSRYQVSIPGVGWYFCETTLLVSACCVDDQVSKADSVLDDLLLLCRLAERNLQCNKQRSCVANPWILRAALVASLGVFLDLSGHRRNRNQLWLRFENREQHARQVRLEVIHQATPDNAIEILVYVLGSLLRRLSFKVQLGVLFEGFGGHLVVDQQQEESVVQPPASKAAVLEPGQRLAVAAGWRPDPTRPKDASRRSGGSGSRPASRLWHARYGAL